MLQNMHTACCTLYKNKSALSPSLFRGLFSVRSSCLFFSGSQLVQCVCVCCVPLGRPLGTYNAWLCSPVPHGRHIASVAEAARQMRRRNSSIGARGGDPALRTAMTCSRMSGRRNGNRKVSGSRCL